MYYKSRHRFTGYWLSLIAWILLTFSSSVSLASSSQSGGWLRLCSAVGASWVALDKNGNGDDLSGLSSLTAKCLCLAAAVPTSAATIAEFADYSAVKTACSIISLFPSPTHLSGFARAPPISS